MRAYYLLAAGFSLVLSACSTGADSPTQSPADASSTPAQAIGEDNAKNNGQPVTQGGALERAKQAVETKLERQKEEINISSPYKYIQTHPDYSILFKVLSTTHYAKRLHGESMTVFAPTNKAMSALPAANLNELLATENNVLREQFIARHVIEKAYSSEKIDALDNLATADGGRLLFGEDPNAPLLVNGVEMPRMHLQLGKSILISTDEVLPKALGK